MPSQLEVEIKLAVPDLGAAVERVERAGARPIHPRQFQDDEVFDFPDRRLAAAGTVLRLRREGERALLTLKEEVGDQGNYKVRREFETAVAEGDAARRLLLGLGLTTSYRYQKYRRTFALGSLLILADELPIGDYLELEGPPEEIDRLAAALGYSKESYITESYRTLHHDLARRRGEDDKPTEMLFEKNRPRP
jgi:adenylate cyclase class 2